LNDEEAAVSLSKTWILALSLTLVGCGGGGGDDPPPVTPDAGPVQGQPDAGGGLPDAAVENAACATYCETIIANCTGENAQYTDVNACLSLCQAANWLSGRAGDTEGNTLGCRTTHAGELAVADPATHCSSAGPAGGGVCGTVCESYCFYSSTYCGDQHAYADAEQCAAACEVLIPNVDTSTGDENTLQCRGRHIIAAGESGDPTAACPVADLHGNNTCGTWCEVYCDLMEINCTGQPGGYEDRTTCLDTCAGFRADGEPNSESGDTVQCRIFHAGVPAVRNPEECGYAGASPTNFCIDVAF
jgi:hypothetical protein